jgi:hypothetical protein
VSSLVSTEFRRFLARELLLVLVTAALAGIIVGALIAAAESKPPDPLALRFLPEWIQGVSFIVLIGGLVLGGSSVGAEWHAGTMTTLLTWEPRRIRLCVAKAIACLVCVFAVAVGLLIVFALAMTLATVARGSTSGLPDSWFGSVSGSILRTAAAATFGSALGFSLAMIGRNTAAALGVTFGYLAIVEGFLRQLRPGWHRWLISENLVVFITGRPQGFAGRSFGGAALLLLLYAGVASFRARDVT